MYKSNPDGFAGAFINVTDFPTSLTLANSWNVNLAREFGEVIGKEHKVKGTTVALGPGVNIARVPWNGRNFEYLSEDPFLASRFAEQLVFGVQSHNISSCIKHYAFNNQETNRTSVSANVDRRTSMEIYYPAFESAVDAGVGSIMCSYNRINGTQACENYEVLEEILRKRFGFLGFIRSDVYALKSTVASAVNGTDQEMPSTVYFGPKLLTAVKNRQVGVERLREMIIRQVTTLKALNMLDVTPPDSDSKAVATNPAHVAFSRRVATEGIVLLRNENQFLPLNAKNIATIAVFGDEDTVSPGDNSSGYVYADKESIITPTKGIISYLTSNGFTGVKVIYGGKDPSNVNLATDADIVVVAVAASATEGQDRANYLALDETYDDLVNALLLVNSKIFVDVRGPGACLMPWISKVKAVTFSGYSGQESGNALADILFGEVNPSGKLALSFPSSNNATWLSDPFNGPINPSQYPGTDRGKGYSEEDYSEGLKIGYRFYLSNRYEPMFAFGFGLSYTTFQYSNLVIAGDCPNFIVSSRITNSGLHAGAEVIQLYITFPKQCNEPSRILKGFHKTQVLAVGAYEDVKFDLNDRSFSFFDVITDNWKILSGQYIISISSSSRNEDILLQTTITI